MCGGVCKHAQYTSRGLEEPGSNPLVTSSYVSDPDITKIKPALQKIGFVGHAHSSQKELSNLRAICDASTLCTILSVLNTFLMW